MSKRGSNALMVKLVIQGKVFSHAVGAAAQLHFLEFNFFINEFVYFVIRVGMCLFFVENYTPINIREITGDRP